MTGAFMGLLLDTLTECMDLPQEKTGKRKRNAQRGDVLCVEKRDRHGLMNQYGICTGSKVVLYAPNAHGDKLVHEVPLKDFLAGTKHFAICELPEQYGRPRKWMQPSPLSGVVMPQERIYRMLELAKKIDRYKCYTPEETARRAESKLGTSGYGSSEHFAMWCKTGIAESHEIESLRDLFERMVMY